MASLRLNAEQKLTGDSRAVGPDFRITYHGTVSTLDLFTDPARKWVEENVATEPWQWLGKRRIGIDPSFAEELREALTEAGFSDGEASGEAVQSRASNPSST